MNRILIVDDELNMRLVLAAMLKKEGYEVTAAADGAEALRILEAGPVAAVVTDLKMPRVFCVPTQTVFGFIGSMVRQKIGIASPVPPVRVAIPSFDGIQFAPPSVLAKTPAQASLTSITSGLSGIMRMS